MACGDRKDFKFDVQFNLQVTAYGRQTVPDRGVVRSCDPLKIVGAPMISMLRLTLKSSGYISYNNRITYHPQKGRGYGHVTLLKSCHFPWCSASRGFVSDSWAACCKRVFWNYCMKQCILSFFSDDWCVSSSHSKLCVMSLVLRVGRLCEQLDG